jgi:hypothetical protein
VLTCCANSKEHAINAITPSAPSRATAGIDWASTDHAVAIIDPDGVTLLRLSVEHTSVGLRSLVKKLRSADVDTVVIERPDGPVVDALLEAGLTVFFIAPNQLKNLRSRYGSAGNKDDRCDAYVLPTRCAPTATGLQRSPGTARRPSPPTGTPEAPPIRLDQPAQQGGPHPEQLETSCLKPL